MRAPPRPTARPRRALLSACLASGATVGFLVCTPPALPALQRDLGAGFEQTQWVTTAYLLPQVALLVAAGALGDRRGHRRIYVAGMGGYAAALVACALAPSAPALALLAAVAGLASAFALGNALSIIALTHTAERRSRALAIWGVSLALSYAIGPPLGGVLAETLGWRAIFAALAALALLGALLAMRGVPAGAGRDARSDPLGTLLLAAGLGAALFALIEGNRLAWGSAPIVGAGAAAVALLAGFTAWERRARAPLLDLVVLAQPTMRAAALAAFGVSSAFFAMTFYLPRYLMSALGASPTAAGAGLLAVTGTCVIAALAGLRLRAHVSDRRLVVLSLVAIGAGAALAAQALPAARYPSLLPGLVLFGWGIGAINGPLAALVADAGGVARSGLANAAIYLCRPLGAAVAVAGLGALLQLRTVAVGPRTGPGAVAGQAIAAGFETVLYVVAACALLAAVGTALLLRGRR